MNHMEKIIPYLETHAGRFEEELKSLLRLASISTDPKHQSDIEQAAHFVHDQFKKIGFATEIMATDGHPVVYAEWLHASNQPTILVYGHYDVQPPDPLDLWTTPPFEPTERNGNIYARGVTDDKGQLFTHIKAVESWIKTEGSLPVNIKFLIEGEEEIGSPNLDPFIQQHREKLSCDIAVISDTSQFAPGVPAITYGLRGLAYFELSLEGPQQDLHSGGFGGTLTNPANALATIISALHDENGSITIPGFYDEVLELSKEERQRWSQLPFDEKGYQDHMGVSGLFGEKGFSTLERKWGRPTCDVNGLYSGYSGEGSKTIVPAKAGAKISCRLVPHQDPKTIAQGFKKLVSEICPTGIRLSIKEFHSSPAVLVPVDSPAVQAAARAIEQGFGKWPVFMRHGGTIPVVTTFQEILNVDTLLLGWGYPDDNTHSPNEKFCLASFHNGIRASASLWQELAVEKLS